MLYYNQAAIEQLQVHEWNEIFPVFLYYRNWTVLLSVTRKESGKQQWNAKAVDKNTEKCIRRVYESAITCMLELVNDFDQDHPQYPSLDEFMKTDDNPVLMRDLSDIWNERDFYIMTHYPEQTLKELSEQLHCSCENVRRIRGKAMRYFKREKYLEIAQVRDRVPQYMEFSKESLTYLLKGLEIASVTIPRKTAQVKTNEFYQSFLKEYMSLEHTIKTCLIKCTPEKPMVKKTFSRKELRLMALGLSEFYHRNERKWSQLKTNFQLQYEQAKINEIFQYINGSICDDDLKQYNDELLDQLLLKTIRSAERARKTAELQAFYKASAPLVC